MNRWKAILAAALIFATGAGTGALVHRAISRATLNTPRDPRTPPPFFDGRSDFIGRLQRDLVLTDEQTRRIDVILQDGRKRNRQIWEGVQPQLREEMKKARERIHAELNPEQRTKYDEIMKRSRERRGPRSEGGSREGGPRPDGSGPGPNGGWRRGGKGPSSPGVADTTNRTDPGSAASPGSSATPPPTNRPPSP